MIFRIILLSLALVAHSSAQGGNKPDAMMKLLQVGTTLENVTVPTYDKSGEPATLLTARKLVLKNKPQGILDIFNGKAKVLQRGEPLTINLKKAQYHRRKNLLKSNNPVNAFQSNLLIKGQGMAYDMVSKELLIQGKTTTVYIPEDVTANIGKALGLMMAQPPYPEPELTAEEKASLARAEALANKKTPELEKAETDALLAAQNTAADAEEKLSKQANAVTKEMNKVKGISEKSDTKLKKFAKKAGAKVEVAQKDKAPQPPKLGEKLPAQALVITSEGGAYFDAENNVLVYLKNVVAENDEFYLKCADNLKVFMEPKEGKKKADKADEPELGGAGSLDVKELLASGNVLIRYKKTGNRPNLIATGGSAFYKMGAGEILIKGGYPKLQQGNNSSEALDPGMWVKLSAKGAVWSKGKQRQIYIPEQ